MRTLDLCSLILGEIVSERYLLSLQHDMSYGALEGRARYYSSDCSWGKLVLYPYIEISRYGTVHSITVLINRSAPAWSFNSGQIEISKSISTSSLQKVNWTLLESWEQTHLIGQRERERLYAHCQRAWMWDKKRTRRSALVHGTIKHNTKTGFLFALQSDKLLILKVLFEAYSFAINLVLVACHGSI